MSSTPSATPAPARGRPTSYCAQTVALLCRLIRQRGLSDTAAARRAGVHPSTLSRWKFEHPELPTELGCAREEYRESLLSVIEGTAHAEGGGGWRAAAWLLERVFPEDYAPRAAERHAFREDDVLADPAAGSDQCLQEHRQVLEAHRSRHPEDFDNEGLYHPFRPAEESSSKIPASPSDSFITVESIPEPIAPAESLPAPGSSPSVPALQNDRNPPAPPASFHSPTVPGMTPVLRRPVPDAYRLCRSL